MPRKSRQECAPAENVQLGPAVCKGELVFSVTHIFINFNKHFRARGCMSD
ncbi:hypothetical protein EJ02DRAFT_424005 [Clathrospora elynae]|uniref:Uncharacterized protein n=1 Tax=Clathrospora elynae TaxID=706981 RepID=A0A6A5SI79_9PLEO|nr:hypothetical protein EJ02DRAFT_424005 [Clathrospora elynae]